MDFGSLDATAQAELVRRREASPLELVDAAIDRVERVNPRLNAVITPMFELAREAARGPLPDG
ncbi:MAG: amidase, partial [Chloroflexota bacterium]